jgi:hypothetical protein
VRPQDDPDSVVAHGDTPRAVPKPDPGGAVRLRVDPPDRAIVRGGCPDTAGGTDGGWSAAANLGSAVNTAAAESRASFSWYEQTLLFGRAPGPEGMSDIYVTTREKAGR